MMRSNEALRRYERVLADRLRTVQGIAEALGRGTLRRLSDEQQQAMEMLDRSARRLSSDLSSLKRSLAAPPEPDAISARR